jgi:hypothetical protein
VLASMGMSHRLKGAWGCIDPPSGAARSQAVRVVARYIEGGRGGCASDFADLTIEALRDAWPCR